MNYGMPYKGSKNTIAQQVVAALPRCDRFLDACCGGGAITQCAAMSGRFKHVVGNDRNAAVVDLLEAVLVTKGRLDFEHPRPCSRRDFAESLERIRSGTYTLWDVVNKLCSSFGNDGRTYLYGEDIEDFKLTAERMLTERTLAGRREAYRQFIGMLTTGRVGVPRAQGRHRAGMHVEEAHGAQAGIPRERAHYGTPPGAQQPGRRGVQAGQGPVRVRGGAGQRRADIRRGAPPVHEGGSGACSGGA